MSATEADASAEHSHPISVVLDDEPLEVPDRHTTPNTILRLAELDPAIHYLVRLEGRERESYKSKGDEVITAHKGEKFVSVSTEPTPTS